jgi:hypothetical protein
MSRAWHPAALWPCQPGELLEKKAEGKLLRALREPEGKNRASHRYKRPLDARAVRPRQQLGDYHSGYNQASLAAVR